MNSYALVNKKKKQKIQKQTIEVVVATTKTKSKTHNTFNHNSGNFTKNGQMALEKRSVDHIN